MEEENADREVYLKAVNVIISRFEDLLGEKTARKYARKGPIDLDPDGEVEALYGKGEDSLELVVEQYEKVWGERVAMKKVRTALNRQLDEEELDMIPEIYRQKDEHKSLVNQIMAKLGAI